MPQELRLKENTLITSKTDLRGIITYGNADFVRFSGYGERAFLGKPHNIIRHPDMPRIAFKLLWEHITEGKEFFAFVKNFSQQGDIYWVFANVTSSYDEYGKIIGYYSVRRAPSKQGVNFMSGVYAKLLEAERTGGMNASRALLASMLDEAGLSYEELVLSLQASAKTQGYY